ncbi:cell division protein FtsK [Streptomyces sp. NPDC046197]|uniref:cell division protein FtsK n=1 Tax=Streptomyces sp. NPDC046197 TaxID=3154337 RepID=UPI0033DF0A8E
MNHPDDNELFNRLEAEMAAASGAEVVDLGKARLARGESADSTARPDADRSPDPGPDQTGGESADSDDERPRWADGPQPKNPGLMGQAEQAARRTVLPPWLCSWPELTGAARWLGTYLGHIVAFHAVRSPVYAGRLVARTPRGIGRTLRGWQRWASDAESAPLRHAEAFKERTEEYLKLSRQRDRRVRWRGTVSAVALPLLLTAALLLAFAAPWWLQTAAAALAIGVFGVVGSPADAPLVQHAVVKAEAPKLTASMVVTALGALGNDKLNAAIKNGTGLRFTSEIHRDGPGWRADVELPHGETAEDIMNKREALASGLRRKLGCVWPMPNPDDHEGTLILWVGDKPMNEAKRPAWPLAKAGVVDLFKPVPFGNNQQMRWVSVSLMFVSIVVGSIPRMGKTYLMRLFLLIAALDPRAWLYIFDFKGGSDYRPLEKVCHRWRSGEDDEDVKYCLDSLLEIKDELTRRAKVIKSLPLSRCPESKVTSELASDKRLGLHPIVVSLDECQKAFEHKTYGGQITEICEDLVRRGPAFGIIAMFGTQRPDKDSIPKGISANAVLRFALKVTGQMENDMILGTSMYKAGYKATMFSFKRDKGVAWMAGEMDEPTIVCGTEVDAVGAEKISLRARKLREDYGNVTGYAIGEDAIADPTAGIDVLADILAVTPADEAKVWNETTVDRLAELRPEVYGTWAEMKSDDKTAHLTAVLKPYGIKTDQVGRRINGSKPVNKRGFTRAHIATAIADRDRKGDAS